MDFGQNPRSRLQNQPDSSLSLPTLDATVTRKRRNTTCDHCRKRHIKCEQTLLPSDVDEGSSYAACKQCTKDQVGCTRSSREIRFSDESGKVGKRKEDTSFPDGQMLKTSKVPSECGVSDQSPGWLNISNCVGKLVYIDETAELNAIYSQDDHNEIPSHSSLIWIEKGDGGAAHARETFSESTITLESSQAAFQTSLQTSQPCNPSSAAVPIDSFVIHGLVKPPWQRSPSFSYNRLEFLLLQYYIDHLSMWLDFCDPQRHFQLVVPQRARRCPPLMNAILAASARHLTRVPKHRTASGNVKYDGRILHELTDETALHYHNKCIHDLLTLGADPEHTRNEDLLAAAIILRFYEEVDYPLQDEKRDNELFLRVINIFIEAQIPNVPLSPPSSVGSTQPLLQSTCTQSSTTIDKPPLGSQWYMANLRQAAFWVAFRQEVYSAFLKQRPFNMSLSRCDFCYGSTSQPSPTAESESNSTREKWTTLRSLSEKWVDLLPSSFEPIYFREADKDNGEVFPEICYLTNLHVAGVQHVELARIMLAVYDPTIPRLGFGHRERMRLLSLELRASVLRLCGIAVYNRKNPPSLTTALLGIVVCGEHFEDRGEQRALLGLLDELEYHHGWPVGNYRARLKESTTQKSQTRGAL
ncbi:hypothetical protein BDV12DRAFT_207318 [Aspergillus spectabilis]